MSMFFTPAFCAPEEPNFIPLFRLLDEWDQVQKQQPQQQQQQQRPKKRQPEEQPRQRQKPQSQAVKFPQRAQPQPQPAPRFQPAFDFHEVEDAYELYGELPGVARENLSIEFPEPQTITVSGKVERNYEQLFPAPAPEPAAAEQPRPHSPYQATVEDDTEDEEYDAVTPVTNNSRPATPITEKTTAEAAKPEQSAQQQQQQQTAAKYWLKERSIGEFSRTFQFPGRVDSDAVTAALENGVLRIRVPKAKAYERRQINIL